MGKSTEEIKKMTKKETAKAPISPIWLGMRRAPPPPPSLSFQFPRCHRSASSVANRALFSNEQVSLPSSSSAA